VASGDVTVVPNELWEALDSLGLLLVDELSCQAALDRRMKKQMPVVPRVEQVELTNACPFRCVMCPRPSRMTRPVGLMDDDLFTEICRQVAPHQRFLSMHHFGESLLHPRLPHLVSVARSYGLHTGLSCNAVCLTEELVVGLLDSGLSSVTFNVDSLDTSRYQRIRGTHKTSEENLRAIVGFIEANRRRSHRTLVSVQMISMRSNRGEGADLLVWAQRAGLDHAVVVKFGQWDFSDEEASKLAVLEARALYSVPCPMRWESVCVLWDGTVVPCCRDYDADLPMGTLPRESLEAIWNTQRYERLRQRQGAFPRCRSCWQSWPYRVQKRMEIGAGEFHRHMDQYEGRPSDTPNDSDVLEWCAPGATKRYQSIHFPVSFRVSDAESSS